MTMPSNVFELRRNPRPGGANRHSQEYIDGVVALWNTGLSAASIAIRIGGTTRNAIIGVIHRARKNGVKVRDRQSRGGHGRRQNRPTIFRPTRIREISDPTASPWRAKARAEVEGAAKPALPAPCAARHGEVGGETIEPPSRKAGQAFRDLSMRLGGVDLISRKECQCPFPVNWGDDQSGGGFFFVCGFERAHGQPYCEAHTAVAYVLGLGAARNAQSLGNRTITGKMMRRFSSK